MDLNTGGIQCLQHDIGGAGTFTGVSLGYAKQDATNGGTTVTFRSRESGAQGNALKVQIVDPRPVATPVTFAIMADDHTLMVFLSTNAAGTALTGTSEDVIDAVHKIRKRCPIAAFKTGSGVMAGTALLSLVGGLDSEDYGGIVSFNVDDGTHGGLFYFDQYLAARVLQFEGQFSGAGNVRVSLVTVAPDLSVFAGSEVTLYEDALGTHNDFHFVPNNGVVLMPSQAVQIIATLQGTARVYTHRDDDLG